MAETRAFFFFAACLFVVAITGCPNAPCAKRVAGALDRCVEATCPKGSAIDDRAGICVCGEGSSMLAGACVPYALADAYCGKGATAAGGACTRKKCGRGEALDRDHGMCLPESSVAATFSHPTAHGSEDAHDVRDETRHRAQCLFGELVMAHNAAACAAGPLSCARGERFVKASVDAGHPHVAQAGTCEPVGACGAGEAFDEISTRCERVMTRGDVVEVGLWARVTIGTDGAEGTNAFCAPVRASGAAGRFQIQLVFADNDVTGVSATLTARPGTGPAASDAAQHSLQDLTNALRFMGGTSSAAAVTLEVACTPASPSLASLEIVRTEEDAGR